MHPTDLETIYTALSSLVSLPQIRTQTAVGRWMGGRGHCSCAMINTVR